MNANGSAGWGASVADGVIRLPHSWMTRRDCLSRCWNDVEETPEIRAAVDAAAKDSAQLLWETSLQPMDYLLLLGIFLETLGDSAIERSFLLYFTENMNLGDENVNYALVCLRILEAIVVMTGGYWFDYFPFSGPLRMFAYANPVRILSSAGLAVLYLRTWPEVGTPGSVLTPTWVVIVVVLLLVAWASSNGCTHMTMDLAINRLRLGRSELVLRRFISYRHAVANMAILLAAGLVVLWRHACFAWLDWSMATANSIVMLSGCGILAVATGWNVWLSTFPEVMWNTTKDSVPRSLYRRTRAAWRSCVRRIRGKRWRDYVMYSLFCFGTMQVYAILGYIMPKYLIRRYDLVTTYSAFDMINPAVVILLTIAAPGIADFMGADTRKLLVGGTFIIGLSPLFMVLINYNYSGIFIFLILLSLGEAIALPSILTVAYDIVPSDEFAIYNSMNKPVSMGLVAVVGQFASRLLVLFCPDEFQCKNSAAPGIWIPVVTVALLTPVLLYLFGIYREWWGSWRLPDRPTPTKPIVIDTDKDSRVDDERAALVTTPAPLPTVDDDNDDSEAEMQTIKLETSEEI